MKKGFTLVELIIVIIIVGILAAVGMTQYVKVVEKGRAAEARMILGTLRTAEIVENTENGAYKAVADLGVGAPTSCTVSHFFAYSCDTTSGTCTAVRCTASGRTPNSATVYTKTLDVAGTSGGTSGY